MSNENNQFSNYQPVSVYPNNTNHLLNRNQVFYPVENQGQFNNNNNYSPYYPKTDMINNINPAVNNGQGFNSNYANSGMTNPYKIVNASPNPIDNNSPNNMRNDNQGFDSNINNLPFSNNTYIQPLQDKNIIINVEVQMPGIIDNQEPIIQMGVDNSKMQSKDEDVKGNNHKRENAKTRIEVCRFLERILMIIIMFAISLSCALIILGVLLKSNASKIVGNLVISFAVVCILFFIYGWGSFTKYHEKITSIPVDSEDMEKNFYDLEDSKERISLDIFIYFLMTILVALIILSFGCIFYQDEMKDYIKSIAVDKATWTKIFGTKDWRDIIQLCSAYMYSMGAIGLVICITIYYLLNLLFSLLGRYEFWQLTIKFISVLFYLIGFLMLYAAVYSEKYREVAKVDKSMPVWVSQGLYGIAICCIVMGVIGFVAAFTERRNYIFYFGCIMSVFTVIILIFSIYGVIYFKEFQNYFENNCYRIIDYINEGYLQNYTICDQKYDFNSTSLRNISSTCPKNRVATIWEINVGKDIDLQSDMYGCFNLKCCLTLYSFILSKIQYAVLLAFVLFVTGLFKVLGCYYMYQHAEDEGGIRESKNMSYLILGIFCVITLIIVVVFIALIPAPPIPQPNQNYEILKAPNNNTQLNISLIIPLSNITSLVKNTTISSNNQTLKIIAPLCSKSSCLAYRYYYEISSTDGTFIATNSYLSSNTTKQKNTTESGKNIFGYYSYNDTLPANWLSYFSFNHKCPLSLSYINLLVSISAYNITSTPFSVPKRIKRSLQTSTNLSSFVFDLTGLAENQTRLYYNDSLDFSLVNRNITQVVIGNIYRVGVQGQQEKLDGANVTLTSLDFPQCNNVLIKTVNGIYKSPQFYVFKSGSPTNYKLQVQYGNLSIFTTSFIVGGLAPSPIINMNDIYLYDPTFNPVIPFPVNNNSQSNSNSSSTIFPTNNNSSNSNTSGSSQNNTISNNSTIIQNNTKPSNSSTSNNSQPTNSTTNTNQSTNSSISNNTQTTNSSTTNNTQTTNSSTNNSSQSTNSSSTNNNQTTNPSSSNNTQTNINNTNTNNIIILNFSINSFIINTLTNNRIPNAAIYLYEGSVVLVNQRTDKLELPTNGKLLGTYYSDNNGNFVIPNLPFGSYTAVFMTAGFYREVKYFTVIGPNTQIGTVSLTPVMTDNSLRFVLSWESSPKDLDIHALFQLSRMQKCEVYFAKKECVGVSLDVDNLEGGTNGVETITINTLGNYIYTIAVNKYIDNSNGVAPGENNVNDDNNNPYRSQNVWANIPLHQSKAKVSVYAPGFSDPIKIISVPIIVDDTTVYGGMETNNPESFDWWIVFCFDGSAGIDSIVTVNKFKFSKPTLKDCSNILTEQRNRAFSSSQSTITFGRR